MPRAALRATVFPGNWRNAMRHYTEIEGFLADHLGGRHIGSS
jgi:hypothetical protein